MIKTLLIALVILIQVSASAQILEKSLPEFKKVVISPFIDVELQKGSSENISLIYENVDVDKINIEVKGKTLKLFLDDAKFGLKRKYFETRRECLYSGIKVKAIITYRSLENIQIAGNNRLSCEDTINGKRLKLKTYEESEMEFASIATEKMRISAYGETIVNVKEVETNKMRIATYGENDINIGQGHALNQTFRAYGDNAIDAKGVRNIYTKVGFFGDNRLAIDSDDHVKLTILGDGDIQIRGGAYVKKGLVLGSPSISDL